MDRSILPNADDMRYDLRMAGAATASAHPRPQLARPGWDDLSGTWGFAHDDGDRGRAERWWADPAPVDREIFDREIVVPFPPESAASGVHDPGYHPVVWYRRTVAVPPPADGERLLLHFGAVDHRADVWVGGTYVGGHEGGHTPFTLDVTDALAEGATLVVRAEDRPTDVTRPRGKQDWRPAPHAIWYHRTTGIWQPVWLERVPALHVAELSWTSDLAAGTVTMDLRFSHPPASPVTAVVVVRLGDEVLAETSARVTDETVRHVIWVAATVNGQDLDRITWSPESPTLLDVEVRIVDGSQVDGRGSVVDRVTSYVGLRSADCADGRFLLNGRTYYLRLVLEQGYWPQSHLAAPSAEALRSEVELIKELGFNGVRVHQKVEDPRFLYWCDRLGLLVWGEMANAYAFSPAAADRLVREWLEVVRRDRSHPCIVTWVPLNESWGVHHIADHPAQRHLVSALYHLTRALDPTRPVIGNDGWEHTESDIWGVHDYGATGAGLTERYGSAEAVRRSLRAGRPGRRRVVLDEAADRGQPVVLSEFGGLSYTPATGDDWFGYSTVGSADELLEKLAELVGAVLDSPALAGFCYTQLTDTEQERNGLLTAGREPKIIPERVREVLTRPARAVPAEEVDALRRRAEQAAGGEERQASTS